MYQINLEQFEGPLDLLLQLIEHEKLDISEVSLAKVTDQYLAYLDQAQDISATDLADFLVVATKLLVIKSRALLPQLEEDAEETADELEAQLKLYKEYLVASQKVQALINRGQFSFGRDRVAVNLVPTFSPPEQLAALDLTKIFEELISRVEYVVNLPKKVMERVVTLKEKVFDLRSQLTRLAKLNFRDLVGDASSKMEVVVSFMALLELLRSGEVLVQQSHIFDDIMINRQS